MARNTSARLVPAPVPVGIAIWYSGVCVSVMSDLAGSGSLRVRGRRSARLAVRRFRSAVGLAIRPEVSDAIRPVAASCPATTWPLATAMPVSPSGFSRIFRPSAALFAALFLRTAFFLRKTGSLNSPDSTRLDEPDQPRREQRLHQSEKVAAGLASPLMDLLA
jgi:hypothetical protein